MRRKLGFVAAVAAVAACPYIVAAQEVADQWRYTLEQPQGAWQTPAFDDAGWTSGAGGFGTAGTPGARIGTVWRTKAIWLRKRFTLAGALQKPALLVYHDEDAEIFINGQPALSLKGYVTEYKVFPLKEEQRALLKAGENVLAVHCRQEAGGQFIDAHVIEADAAPALPTPERRPFVSALVTPWGEKVTDQNAWQAYPRPRRCGSSGR